MLMPDKIKTSKQSKAKPEDTAPTDSGLETSDPIEKPTLKDVTLSQVVRRCSSSYVCNPEKPNVKKAIPIDWFSDRCESCIKQIIATRRAACGELPVSYPAIDSEDEDSSE